jgi:hypothetical protein
MQSTFYTACRGHIKVAKDHVTLPRLVATECRRRRVRRIAESTGIDVYFAEQAGSATARPSLIAS